jgi:hypothetical protein
MLDQNVKILKVLYCKDVEYSALFGQVSYLNNDHAWDEKYKHYSKITSHLLQPIDVSKLHT